MLIAITGKLESGKSTLAKEIKKHHGDHGVCMMAFAKTLKDMCSSYFGFSYTDLYTPEGKIRYNERWGMTTREFMQRLGQGLRDAICSDVWVKLLKGDILVKKDVYDIILVDDCRYPEEINMIHELGGIVVRIVRPDHEAISNGIKNHPSEQDLPDEMIDYELVNDCTPEELYNRFHLMVPSV